MSLSTKVGFAFALAVILLISSCGCPNTGNIPLDDAWQTETYRAGKESSFGALAITSVKPSDKKLEMVVNYKPGNLDLERGEILRYLEDCLDSDA